ncbi:MAG: NAD(P)H-dependent oxidoreductase [Bacteroidota bacterium]
MKRILKINASARKTGSTSRELVDKIINQLVQSADDYEVINRDLLDGVPLLTEEVIGSFFTPESNRTAAQKEALTTSDSLAEELKLADVIVLGTPIYNFSVPGSLKAYFDLIARAGVTFQYTGNGPVGLLKNKKAIVAITSGGTAIGSDMDFASDYIKLFLGFIGITDVTFVNADQLMFNGTEKLEEVNQSISAIAV